MTEGSGAGNSNGNSNGTSTVTGAVTSVSTEATPREHWADIESLLSSHWHEPDLEAVRAQVACVAAHALDEYNPAWCMAIAPSGSAKTVILEAMEGVKNFRLIDEVTQTTFISGKFEDDSGLTARELKARDQYKGKGRLQASRDGSGKVADSASLLHRLGNSAIIAVCDFSTILSTHETSRNKIFSQMRRIYDGSLSREFGNPGDPSEREWHGRVTFMAAVTPEVDRYGKMFSALGDRFLRVRWPRASGVAAMLAASRQSRDTLNRLKVMVREFMTGYLESSPKAPDIPEEMLTRIGELSELVCIARTYVHTDSEGKPDGEPSPESNTRLPQQLCQMARGWAALMGDAQVTEESMRLVWRVAMDCLPPARRAVLESSLNNSPTYGSYISPDSIRKAVADLTILGLLELPGLDSVPGAHVLTPLALGLFSRAGTRPRAGAGIRAGTEADTRGENAKVISMGRKIK